MRRKFVWSPDANALVEVSTDYRAPQRSHYVIPDTPDYVSPVSGLVVSGRKQRREDLKRTNSRPWEGMKTERAEAERRKAYQQQKFDAGLDRAARQAFYQLPPEKRRILEGR